jgi:hypothetical protein
MEGIRGIILEIFAKNRDAWIGLKVTKKGLFALE